MMEPSDRLLAAAFVLLALGVLWGWQYYGRYAQPGPADRVGPRLPRAAAAIKPGDGPALFVCGHGLALAS